VSINVADSWPYVLMCLFQRIKLRVRLAKVFLRFVGFFCSLILIALLGTTLAVFHATKSLARRGGKPPWAPDTNPWPQYLILALASVSLLACLIVFWGYWRGGHKRAEKSAKYYTTFAVCFFTFSFILWVVATALYQNSKATSSNMDLWGWSCVHNVREQYFQEDVDYALLCRLQVSPPYLGCPYLRG
jgi:magnesium-transporting ATPase (P-type)